MMNGYGYGMGGWFGMGLWWIVIVVLLVAAVVFVFRRAGDGKSSAPPESESARDVLDKRYARGEIGRDEYEQKKRDLAP
jgi:putative membrane protein